MFQASIFARFFKYFSNKIRWARVKEIQSLPWRPWLQWAVTCICHLKHLLGSREWGEVTFAVRSSVPFWECTEAETRKSWNAGLVSGFGKLCNKSFYWMLKWGVNIRISRAEDPIRLFVEPEGSLSRLMPWSVVGLVGFSLRLFYILKEYVKITGNRRNDAFLMQNTWET